MKNTKFKKVEKIYDRSEFKLIERITKFKKNHPKCKIGEIQRPLTIGGISDGVFEVEVKYWIFLIVLFTKDLRSQHPKITQNPFLGLDNVTEPFLKNIKYL